MWRRENPLLRRPWWTDNINNNNNDNLIRCDTNTITIIYCIVVVNSDIDNYNFTRALKHSRNNDPHIDQTIAAAAVDFLLFLVYAPAFR